MILTLAMFDNSIQLVSYLTPRDELFGPCYMFVSVGVSSQ